MNGLKISRQNMENWLNVEFKKAETLLREGDVLLFRGKGMISWFIRKWTGGLHTHVGLASKTHNIWECVEFREFKGGRAVSLESQVNIMSGQIDVFRPNSDMMVTYFDGLKIIREHKKYSGSTATNIMRKMTGLPYGYRRIWEIAKSKIFGLRMLSSYNMDDKEGTFVYPVCSSATAHCVRRGYLPYDDNYFVDPIKWKNDNETTPSDLAGSCIFNYLFTLIKNGE